MKRSRYHSVRLAVLIAALALCTGEVFAQLPVRTRELHLFSNNNVNYTLVQSADGITANWSLTLPPDEGSTGSMLLSTVAGTDASVDWLAPGNEGDALIINGGAPTWIAQGSLFWALEGNDGTTAWNGATGNFVGTGDVEDLVFATDSAYSMKIIGDPTGNAGSRGRIIIGERTGTPGVPNAPQAEELVNILGGNLRFDSENNGAITRQILFDGTAGTGNFRIGSDGGDITWQGGGGRQLQMASFWGIQLIGNRGVTGVPAFVAGAASNPSVSVIGTRAAAPILTTTPPSPFTGNQQEWRDNAGSALSVMNNVAHLGLGVTTAINAKLQIDANATAGNAIQLDPWAANPGNTGEIRFRELAASGVDYVGFKAPDALATPNIYTLPSAYPTADDYVLTSSTLGVMTWQDPNSLVDNFWSLTGNTATNPATNFLGTTDAQDLVIRTDNTERLRVNATGELGIGTTATAGYLLEVDGVAGDENVRLTSLSAASADAVVSEGMVTADANGDLRRRSTADALEILGIGRGVYTPAAPASSFVVSAGAFDVLVGATINVTVQGASAPAVHAMVTTIDAAADTFTVTTSATIDNTYNLHWMVINP